MRKIKINSLYKHFKGHIYKVIAIGKNSEDLTDMVVYENIENHEIWIILNHSFYFSVISGEKNIFVCFYFSY